MGLGMALAMRADNATKHGDVVGDGVRLGGVGEW